MKRIDLKKYRKERPLYKTVAIIGLLFFCCQIVLADSSTTEIWYPDAPYYNLKSQYESILASEPNIATNPDDINKLTEEFELARYLSGEDFENWSHIFGEDAKGRDQYEKSLKLYEHIVKYYPQNEYQVLLSRAQLAGLTLNLTKEPKAAAQEYTEVFSVPVDTVVDSSDESRNKPLQEAGGKTQAQLDFEEFIKGPLRNRVIELCLITGEIEPYVLLGQIMTTCELSDPEIDDMAYMAKIDFQDDQAEEIEKFPE